MSATASPPRIDPYYGRPTPSLLAERDILFAEIARHPAWEAEFAEGRMTGLLLAETADGRPCTLRAYSGTMHLDDAARAYFVPPVCDLDRPDEFYRTEERSITALTRQLDTATDPVESARLKQERAQRSLALQREIFHRFVFQSPSGQRRDLIEIFASTRHTLPPGGTGECAAPRLFHHAATLGLRPLAMAEFWYGKSPAGEVRVHRSWYPSCMEKCAPILAWVMTGDAQDNLAPPRPEPVGAADKPEVVCETDDLVVVNKPAGMLSVPGKDDKADSVEQWLLRRYPTCHAPMLVHRLDMATSGLLVAAKTADGHKRLQSQFAGRAVGKRYVAWLDGTLPSACGILNLPLCPNPEDRPRQVVDFHFGKNAVTRYAVLARHDGKTLVALRPLSGRTHQLRVHAADVRGLGMAIVGDTLYASATTAESRPAQRLMLHAERLTFYPPAGGSPITVESPAPF